jgi:hypothetical protein
MRTTKDHAKDVAGRHHPLTFSTHIADHHRWPHARMATYGELRQDMYYKSIRDFLYLGKNEWGMKRKTNRTMLN